MTCHMLLKTKQLLIIDYMFKPYILLLQYTAGSRSRHKGYVFGRHQTSASVSRKSVEFDLLQL